MVPIPMVTAWSWNGIAAELLCGVCHRFGSQADGPGTRRKTRPRLVESNMPIGANADDEQIDSSHIPNGFFVIAGFIRKMSVSCRDVDMIEKMLVHAGVKAIRIVLRQSEIFIKVECAHLGKTEALIPVHPHKLRVHSERRSAGRQPQDQLGSSANGFCNEFCRRLAERLIIRCYKDPHFKDYDPE